MSIEQRIADSYLSMDDIPDDIKPIIRKVYKNIVIKRHITDNENTSQYKKIYLLKEFINIVGISEWYHMYSIEKKIIFGTTSLPGYLACRRDEKFKDTLVFLNRRYTTEWRFENASDLERMTQDESVPTTYLNWANKDLDFIATELEAYLGTPTAIWFGNGIYMFCQQNFIIAPESSLTSTKTLTKLYLIAGRLAVKNGLTKEYLESIVRYPSDYSMLTDEEQEQIENFLLVKEARKHINDFKDRTAENLRRLNRQKQDHLSAYEQLLRKESSYQLKVLKLTSDFENCLKESIEIVKRYKELGYISNVKYRVNNDCFEIILKTKIMPILYIDNDILKSAYRAGYYDLYEEEKQMVERYLEQEDISFATGPTKVTIRVPIHPDINFSIGFESITSLPINGHAQYSCLGTFAQPMIDASNDLNIKKLIALAIQYLQSISPHDAAGKRTIQEQIILDSDLKIVRVSYSPYRSRLEGLSLKDIKYDTQSGGII